MNKLIKFWIALGLAAWIGLSLGSEALAANTRLTYPSAASVEVLGRGVMWSVAFDRVLNEDLAAGIGIGGMKLDGRDDSATVIPAYFNYYFAREQGSLFATGGVSVVAGAGDVEGFKSDLGGLKLSSAIVPTFGLGYENRSDAGGFLFRLAAYGMVGANVIPWGGITLGWAF